MILLEVPPTVDAPSLTDWIQAVAAALGIPGAIAAFIILFLRDKDKDEAINSLAELVRKQDEVIGQMHAQLHEFSQQTKELKEQTYLTSVGNSLLSDQVKVLTDHFDFTKEVTISRRNQESQDRKKALLPRFRFEIAAFNGSVANVRVQLVNAGKTATYIQVDQHSPHIDVRVQSENVAYMDASEPDEKVNLFINYVTRNSTDFFFRLNFKDADGNGYLQTMLYQNDQFKITDPVSAN